MFDTGQHLGVDKDSLTRSDAQLHLCEYSLVQLVAITIEKELTVQMNVINSLSECQPKQLNLP